MMFRWALLIDRRHRSAVGLCRLLPGLELAESGAEVWLRGGDLSETAARTIRSLPAVERFVIEADGGLRPEGKLLVSQRLPSLRWTSIREAVPVALPAATYAGNRVRPAAPTLVRSASPATPNLLLVPVAEWSRYGGDAPQVRLQHWTFAVDSVGRALVRGLPLPPLPGLQYVEQEGVALPAGWEFSPALAPSLVARTLGLADREIALFHPDGSWERVPPGQFVQATRAAIRLAAAHGGEERPTATRESPGGGRP